MFVYVSRNGDPLLYDLVLNTDRVSVESCVAQIQQLAGRPGPCSGKHADKWTRG